MELTPFQIVMANRTRTPTLEELVQQVNALARALNSSGFNADSHYSTTADHTLQLAARLSKGPTPTSPARSLNTAFQIGTDYPVLVIYAVQLSVSSLLNSAQTSTVDLRVDASNPPTASAGIASLSTNQTAGLSVTSSTTTQGQLVAWVPPGFYVNLVTSGSGTASLVSQMEVPFNV